MHNESYVATATPNAQGQRAESIINNFINSYDLDELENSFEEMLHKWLCYEEESELSTRCDKVYHFNSIKELFLEIKTFEKREEVDHVS